MSEGPGSPTVRDVKLPDAQTHEHHAHGQPSKYTEGNYRFERHARFRRRSLGLRLRIGEVHQKRRLPLMLLKHVTAK